MGWFSKRRFKRRKRRQRKDEAVAINNVTELDHKVSTIVVDNDDRTNTEADIIQAADGREFSINPKGVWQRLAATIDINNITNDLTITKTTNAGGVGIKFDDHLSGDQLGAFRGHHGDTDGGVGTGYTFKFSSTESSTAVKLEATGGNSGFYVGSNKLATEAWVNAKASTSCKTYVESYTTTRTFNNGNASVLKLFSTRTIQAGKDVDIYLRVPARDNTTSWGGLYININVKVNGTWHNLGNSGYDGGVMAYSSNDIATSHHHKHLDFIANAGVSATSSYTVQFEVTCRAYNGTTTVNGSHDINTTANNLGSRGALRSWGSSQNYTTLIIKETNR